MRGYHKDVPLFLRNRPPFFLEHCLKRLPQTSGITIQDITAVTSGIYIVRRPEQQQGYEVCLHSPSSPDLPSCDCVDWKRHCLPCKHILAILVLVECWKSLPLYYRSIRQFSVDPLIAPTEEADSVHEPEELTAGTESDTVHEPEVLTAGTESPAAYTESAQYAASSVQSGFSGVMSLQSKVRQTLRAMSELTYVTDNVEFLQQELQQLEQQLQDFKRQSSRIKKKVIFRINRRLVRKSIRSSFLRRRLAAVRAKRSARRKERLLKKSQLPGDKLFLTVFTNGLYFSNTVTTAHTWGKKCPVVLFPFVFLPCTSSLCPSPPSFVTYLSFKVGLLKCSCSMLVQCNYSMLRKLSQWGLQRSPIQNGISCILRWHHTSCDNNIIEFHENQIPYFVQFQQ